jgi:hypothetical protein
MMGKTSTIATGKKHINTGTAKALVSNVATRILAPPFEASEGVNRCAGLCAASSPGEPKLIIAAKYLIFKGLFRDKF